MPTETADIFISGGGIAGMLAAISFGKLGFSVICADPTVPVTDQGAKGADTRSTAFLQPARALLMEAGLWESLAPFAAPLQTMRIIDAGGADAQPRVQTEFNAADISEEPFGWNFPNWLLRRECLAEIGARPNIDLRLGVGVHAVLTRTDHAHITLSDGSQIMAKLLIGADGRSSTVRSQLGIGVKTKRYGQKALAFTVTHPTPHQNVSTEIHRTGGPFTLVPLPDANGLPASAVVWMERSAEAERLTALRPDAFTEAMNARSCLLFGPLTLTSPRTLWPIITQYAEQIFGERTALIAEAAHVVPPIGAQGLNMSLGDLSCLLELSKAAPDALGSRQMLERYHRARHGEIRARLAGIDMLNRASMAQAQPLRDLRALGLNAIHGLTPLRKSLMQLGLGMKR
ncbi:UbiH/UbiF family hydroxylase [Lentibacter algarum]|uniref:UbiH/UbiF family hydroxylase n=1 Tax=Lentibacter algarum TaxID=576131 RepID=UPI001C087D99|nr:UbiH/UbiF family hydroxylase [Lentibacter algarum]MBU2983451.1 UbiH/UbiF family hydroxylase [Lentibacter algarum]